MSLQSSLRPQKIIHGKEKTAEGPNRQTPEKTKKNQRVKNTSQKNCIQRGGLVQQSKQKLRESTVYRE